MSKYFFKPAFLLMSIFLTNWTTAQFYDSAISKFEEQFPKEKIHIHFDKTIYNLNETIFYKLYILEGNDLTTLSKNVYVTWYDTNGNFIKETVAPLIQSSAKGSFDLPSTYKGNFIHIKAFTRWMLNDDSIFLYEKYIPINAGSLAKINDIAPRTKVEIFPEGGVLVNGLNTKLAFKATNGSGMPVYIKGVLQNSKNEILDSIMVSHDGMGVFHLTPLEGEHYSLIWIDEHLHEGITSIMPAQKEGVSLNISMGYKKAFVKLERTRNVPNNYKQLKLLVHQNQHLLYSVDFKSGDPLEQKIGLNIDTFPTGIVQFSLFTNDWLPIEERIIFVNNRLPEFETKIATTITNLNKRGKNSVEVEVLDSSDANMSISITDATFVLPEQQSIFSDFLLNNEIKGKVYNPAYYFSSDADSVADHLDLVMLTNGWRKFDWDKLRAGILPKLKCLRELDYMKLTGNVSVNSKTKLPKDLLLNIVMQAKDSSKQFLVVPVSPNGSFEDKSVIFYDTSRIAYSFNDNVKLTSKSDVHFNNGLLNIDDAKIGNHTFKIEQNWGDSKTLDLLNNYLSKQEFLRKQMESTTLKEVVVNAKIKTRIQQLDEEYPSAMFKGGIGYFYDVENDLASKGYSDIISYLRSKVPHSLQNINTEIFLDDVRLEDKEMILPVQVSSVAYVKVFRGPFIASLPGGVIAIYTKHSNSKIEDPDHKKAVENAVLNGYSVFKEFYNPNYENASDNFLPDNRTTLYWNPYVLTNTQNKKVNIEFYNNDTSKKLQIILEGVNSNGKLTRVVKYLE